MTDRAVERNHRSPGMAWTLSGAICLLAIENVWIDRDCETVAPSSAFTGAEALSGTWFMVLMAVSIWSDMAVVCQVLLMRDSRLSMRKKARRDHGDCGVGLSAKWVVATSGTQLFRAAAN